MTENQKLVLEVLAGQSPNYLVRPEASAFWAVGLQDFAENATLLEELRELGYANLEEVVVEFTTKNLVDRVETRPVLDEAEEETGEEIEVIVGQDVVEETAEEIQDEGYAITDAGRDALAAAE